jgi:uncharacterized damage-inducible protein DinB
MTSDDLLAEYEHTWDRHRGQVSVAAAILGMKPASLSRALYRARKRGIEVRMCDDRKAAS